MQNEFEEKEKAAQEELVRAKAKLSEIDEQIRKIDECLSYKFTKVFIQGNFDYFNEYQNTWLPMLEALGNPDTNLTIKRQREAFSKPNPQQLLNGLNPTNAINNSLKPSLSVLKIQLVRDRDDLLPKVSALEEKAERLLADKKSTEIGENTLKLTQRGIRISLWLPIVTLLAGTILFETFKPEITNLLRHLVGLSALP